jgi:hypothetical protein
MNIYAPGVEPEREDRLTVALRLYKSLVAQYPERLITLCDDRGRVVARSDRPESMPPKDAVALAH